MTARPRAFTAVGHLGWDVVESLAPDAQRLGGSLFHFLNGVAFTGVQCIGATWTTPNVAARAQALLPPWISLHNRPVDEPPTFNIAYEGETVTRFDISGIEMPSDVPGLTPPSHALHFSAMPFGDAAAILEAGRPPTWSMQFHGAVMPDPSEFRQLHRAPTTAFCTRREYEELVQVVSVLPGTTWIITQRDRVVAMCDGEVVAQFAFSPIESPVDTTGAGDLLAGGVLGCLQRGLPLDIAIRFGAGVAAISLDDQGSVGLERWWECASASNRP